jgi:hypothetical protein
MPPLCVARRVFDVLRDVTSLPALIERAHDEAALGVPWRIPTARPTHAGVAAQLRRAARELDAIAAAVEADACTDQRSE